MTTLKWNSPSSFTIDYMNGGLAETYTLSPGVNLNVDESALNAMRQHAIFRALLEENRVEILLRDPANTSELSGMTVTDDAKSGQPVPVQPATRGSKVPNNPAVQDAIEKEAAR